MQQVVPKMLSVLPLFNLGKIKNKVIVSVVTFSQTSNHLEVIFKHYFAFQLGFSRPHFIPISCPKPSFNFPISTWKFPLALESPKLNKVEKLNVTTISITQAIYYDFVFWSKIFHLCISGILLHYNNDKDVVLQQGANGCCLHPCHCQCFGVL